MTPNKSDSGELDQTISGIVYKLHGRTYLDGDTPNMDYPKQAIQELKAAATAHIQAIGDKAFKEGQRVGQYQAADKLYSHTTTMWMFKDDLENPKIQMPERADNLLKDCEKYLNHNRKTYQEYLKSDRYKRLAQYLGEKQDE